MLSCMISLEILAINPYQIYGSLRSCFAGSFLCCAKVLFYFFFKFYAVPFVYFAFVLLPESAKLLQSHLTLCNLMDCS